jgi:hypothetical protein
MMPNGGVLDGGDVGATSLSARDLLLDFMSFVASMFG